MRSIRFARVVFSLAAAALLLVPAALARAADGPIDLQGLAERATADDARTARAAIAELRRAGPAGLRALTDANADAIRRHVAAHVGVQSRTDDAAWRRTSAAIDAIAAQKDAHASGLYWYTDFDAAKRAARDNGKPILSLRLLGTLDTEFSCANSRFFRTALYANREVSAALAGRFVLHWKSVRPVPKVTIDFGDGRKVERTITGNSIHYVLDAEGNVVDAIPGLYGPKAFLEKLDAAAATEKDTRGMAAADREAFMTKWHAGQADQALRNWQADLRRAGVTGADAAAARTTFDAPEESTPEPPPVNGQRQFPLLNTRAGGDVAPPAGGAAGIAPAAAPASAAAQSVGQLTVADLVDQQLLAGEPAPPPAVLAGLRAMTKAAPEMPLVRGLALGRRVVPPANAVFNPPPAIKAARLATAKRGVEVRLVAAVAPVPDARVLEAASDDAAWQKVAALHADEARLDESSRALIAAKNPAAVRATTEMANVLADSKAKVETPLLKLVRNFERSVAEDTVRNEYTFHRTIHTWLAGSVKAEDAILAKDVDALNERVYAELFLTPSSDPWLGLLPPDTYTALEGDGICTTK